MDSVQDGQAIGDLGAAWQAAMRRGDFAACWDVDAAVRAARDPATRDDPALPYHRRWVWDGRRFDGRHVLVRCYHGLGDTLQFLRYLPALRQRAASTTLEAQPELLPLLAGAAGIDRLIPFDVAHPAPPAECDIEIMELASALRLHPAGAPPPYLAPAPIGLAGAWLGLCWRAGDWDAGRSIPEGLLAPLTRVPAVSLCLGATELPVLNPAGAPASPAQTAALVASLRLVVTVDTMVAHLAGAMNIPTWLLLQHDSDWRWLGERGDSPWYPAMRLYRQPAASDWETVVRRVSDDLAQLSDGRCGPTPPPR